MASRQGLFLFLFLFLFIIVPVVLVMVGFFTLMIVVDLPSQEVKLDATAKLSEFSLDNNTSMVRYKLSVNVRFRNPSKKAVIDYDHIEVTAYYRAHRLDSGVLLAPFRQPRENTTVLAAAFHGQSQLGRGGEFEHDKASGVYEIRVGLFLMVRSRLGKSNLLHSNWCQTQRHFPFHLPILPS